MASTAIGTESMSSVIASNAASSDVPSSRSTMLLATMSPAGPLTTDTIASSVMVRPSTLPFPPASWRPTARSAPPESGSSAACVHSVSSVQSRHPAGSGIPLLWGRQHLRRAPQTVHSQFVVTLLRSRVRWPLLTF